MVDILKKSLIVMQKQWKLVLITTVFSVLFYLDYDLKDENFGLVILVAIPYLIWFIYSFYLTKLIDQKIEQPKTTVLESYKSFIQYIPRLFLPMLALIMILAALMTIIITMVYGIFNILGIENSKSIFDSGPRDSNFIIFNLLFNCAISFLNFQAVFYFLKKQQFLSALRSSVLFSKDHLAFTLIIGLIYFLVTLLTSLITMDNWAIDIFNGVITSVQYYYLAIVFILFYRKQAQINS